ncbi:MULTISPECIES: class I SAM-dependent DNA methyltransferase [unclassified Cytobacillus]|uniref:class I SAM-dependent DNA methyltransferase n=1 Tax=unclassified Cytobacillus TaxID=2675268 RepID=UPI00203ECF43|nr:class I SAM-dependent methyltransferase [Cytobacillus sp. AMY 15.2]MCM3091034.1 class I SAM-dependent methyltransferase [Cytobacillus sp. AMY 15.2]
MGREFVDLFDHWAESYDQAVTGKDLEYQEVFLNYENILQEVANLADGNVIEFGAGTGNLTQKLLEKGANVTGIEPSAAMREIARSKLPDVPLLNGDFLDFQVNGPADALVSTYAFHHLEDAEKAEAIKKYSSLLSKGGKVIFADTLFKSEEVKQDFINEAKVNHFLSLAQDLETEYYTTIPVLKEIFQSNGFSVQFKQLNRFVWLIYAVKLKNKIQSSLKTDLTNMNCRN